MKSIVTAKQQKIALSATFVCLGAQSPDQTLSGKSFRLKWPLTSPYFNLHKVRDFGSISTML